MNAGGRFATTRWTMVNAAGATSDVHSRRALTELCQIYWPPLYSYLRRRGHDREEAEDLTQGFFLRLLERNDIRAADPLRGRFRGFLLTSLKRYVINEHERAGAAKRGGRLPIALDFDTAERTYEAAWGRMTRPIESSTGIGQPCAWTARSRACERNITTRATAPWQTRCCPT